MQRNLEGGTKKMQRQIKFRAWSNAFDQMIPWEELKFDKDQSEDQICFYEKADGCDSTWDGGTDYAIMQYTGLCDKVGREIYEGDICRTFGSYENFQSEVVYQNGAFGYCVKYQGFISFAENYNFHWENGKSEHIEVIENVFENPGLLVKNEAP